LLLLLRLLRSWEERHAVAVRFRVLGLSHGANAFA
jgi:hypothetical protein